MNLIEIKYNDNVFSIQKAKGGFMDAILFSADPNIVDIKDAICHLEINSKLYFEVKFPIIKSHFTFPIAGFIHIRGDQVRYVANIQDILPFSREHYENPTIANTVKPTRWIEKWFQNVKNGGIIEWKYALVITKISEFNHVTSLLQKPNGKLVVHPPQNYIKILVPKSYTP